MKYRPEIDGLRAIAVSSVVFYHAFPLQINGGFIGVDIFFVISGFLISLQIFEQLKNNQFSLFFFYGRRIKRILPALIFVILISLIFGWFVLLPDEYVKFGKHSFGGSAFIANFIFANEIGYFDNQAITKPLLHLWSLSVEEQFYIFWPLVVLIFFKLNYNLFKAILIITFISFCMNIYMLNFYSSENFFLPFGRFWEISTGSILAWLTVNQDKYLTKLNYLKNNSFLKSFNYNKNFFSYFNGSTAFSLFGFFLLFFGFFYIKDDNPYPSFWTLIPIIGTTIIILSGSKNLLNRLFLINPFLKYVGLISYPLYLLHWPIISFAFIISGENLNLYLKIFAILLSILLASFTYHFIENPIRRGSVSLKKTFLLSMTLIAVCAFSILILIGLLKPLSYYYYDQSLYPTNQTFSEILPTPEHNKLKCFDRLGISKSSNIRYCAISDKKANPTVALIGDSHSAAVFRGASYYLKKKYDLTVVNLAGRLFSNVINSPKGNIEEELNYLGGFEVADYLAKTKSITTIIMVSRGYFYLNWAENFSIPNKPYLTSKEDIFLEGIKDLVERFKDKQIIFVLENPTLSFPPSNCKKQRPIRLYEDKCYISRDEDEMLHGQYIMKTTKLLSNYRNVKVVDPRDDLCDDRYCYAIKEGKLLYSDRNHMNLHGSFVQGKTIANAFEK